MLQPRQPHEGREGLEQGQTLDARSTQGTCCQWQVRCQACSFKAAYKARCMQTPHSARQLLTCRSSKHTRHSHPSGHHSTALGTCKPRNTVTSARVQSQQQQVSPLQAHMMGELSVRAAGTAWAWPLYAAICLLQRASKGVGQRMLCCRRTGLDWGRSSRPVYAACCRSAAPRICNSARTAGKPCNFIHKPQDQTLMPAWATDGVEPAASIHSQVLLRGVGRTVANLDPSGHFKFLHCKAALANCCSCSIRWGY
jgi:hypothetical protein